MKEKRIWITERDAERLRSLLGTANEDETEKTRHLETRLKQAKVVESKGIPEGVVTMNCLVQLLDLDTSEKTECWLRFPGGPQPSSRTVSVLSDLGIALLGSEEGSIIEWEGPSGKKRSKIVEIVYQPERLGNKVL